MSQPEIVPVRVIMSDTRKVITWVYRSFDDKWSTDVADVPVRDVEAYLARAWSEAAEWAVRIVMHVEGRHTSIPAPVTHDMWCKGGKVAGGLLPCDPRCPGYATPVRILANGAW
jgi:hypothetical protein